MGRYRFVYMIAKDRGEAERIGTEIVKEKLVACVNICDGIKSIYRWKGKIESAYETVLIAKTSEECVPALISRVKELHSYSCPCVVTIPILDGNEDYLRWIGEETSCQG